MNGTDWKIDTVVKVTDGDTVRVLRRRSFQLVHNLWCDVYDRESVPIRLITLDTPERGNKDWALARHELMTWIDMHPNQLRVETWEGGGFGRLLGDIYVAGDRGDTASQWMLQRRWSSYLPLR